VKKVYVVTAPDPIRGVYEDWPSCQAAVHGVKGARFQAVSSREEAEALLSGAGVQLPPGDYAFIDGNAGGGIGVVLVTQQGCAQATVEVSTTVMAIFRELAAPIDGLDWYVDVDQALGELRNVFAELAAAFHAIQLAPAGRPVTIVHDYVGVGHWLRGEWKAADPRLRAVIHRALRTANEKGLHLRFHHQPAHRSTWAGPHAYAAFNARADTLARLAVGTGAGG
jgi:hypothetical protein